MTSSRIRSFSQPDEDRGLQALKGFPGEWRLHAFLG